MPRACSVCTNPAREAVDRDLVGSRPLVDVAAEYGFAPSSLRRHRDRHLAPKLADAFARRGEIDADKLAAWVLGLNDRVLVALAKTEQARDWQAFRGLVREARENVALLGRLAGVLDAPSAALSIDARRQVAILGSLSEDELRALAASAMEGSDEADARCHAVAPLPAIPHGFRENRASE